MNVQPKETHRFMWPFYQTLLVLHREAFKIVVLGPRQSHSPVWCLQQKAKSEIWGTVQKRGKPKSRSPWQDADISGVGKPTMGKTDGWWSKAMVQIWQTKTGCSKSRENLCSSCKKLIHLSAGQLPTTCRETLKSLLWSHHGPFTAPFKCLVPVAIA